MLLQTLSKSYWSLLSFSAIYSDYFHEKSNSIKKCIRRNLIHVHIYQSCMQTFIPLYRNKTDLWLLQLQTAYFFRYYIESGQLRQKVNNSIRKRQLILSVFTARHVNSCLCLYEFTEQVHKWWFQCSTFWLNVCNIKSLLVATVNLQYWVGLADRWTQPALGWTGNTPQ